MPHDKKHSSQNLPLLLELGQHIQYSDSVTGLWTGWSGVQIVVGKKYIFLLSKMSRLALGHTQPPFWYIQGILSLGVKLRMCEADNSPPSNAEVKNDRSHKSRCLNYMHQDNFIFYHKYFCQVHKICTRCH